MSFGHLVVDVDAVAPLGRVLEGELYAAHGVLDVYESAGLAARAVDGERVADGGLHQEAVEDGAVVAIVVEAVYEALVQPGLGRLGSPHDALVQIGDACQVVLVVVGEQELILGLGHVVDAARVRRVEDLLLYDLAPIGLDLDRQVPLGDLHPGRAVTVDAHGPQMHHVGVEPALGDRREQVVGRVEVVVHGVALVIARLHRVGCGPLLGDVDVVEVYLVACQLLPDAETLAHGANRGEGLAFQLDVYLAPGEVVDNCHLISLRREVQRGGPAAEAVAAQYEYLHYTRSLLLYVTSILRSGSKRNRSCQPAIVAENG